MQDKNDSNVVSKIELNSREKIQKNNQYRFIHHLYFICHCAVK